MIELISYGAFFLTLALTFGIMCLGLNVQWGQTGLFNVGVAGFVGIGAYVSALLTTPAVPEHLGGFDLPIVVGWILTRFDHQHNYQPALLFCAASLVLSIALAFGINAERPVVREESAAAT